MGKGGLVFRHTKVKGSDEEHVNALHGSDFFHLAQSLSRLNLDHCQESVVCLLQVLRKRRHGIEPLGRDGGSESSLAPGRELGSLNQLSCLVCRTKQWDENLKWSTCRALVPRCLRYVNHAQLTP